MNKSDFNKLVSHVVEHAIKQVVQTPIHGANSVFGGIGIEPEVVSTMLVFRGIGDILPRVPSPYLEEFLPFVLGVSETSGVQPSDVCSDCITGETTGCLVHLPSGHVCFQTPRMTITSAMDRINRGDINLQLLNDQLNTAWSPTGLTQTDIMNIATAWALYYELPPLFARQLSKMIYTGNPVNNSGNGYKEFRGLEMLVSRNIKDALTNVACPGLDAELFDFNYADAITASGPTLYELIEMTHYACVRKAEQQGLAPVEHVVAMRPELWHLLSQVIPVQKVQAALMTWAANAGSAFSIQFNGTEIVNERDSLRNLGVMPLNGKMVRVVADDGIPELDATNSGGKLSAGQYASDVYVLPVTFLSNRPALQVQYKDFRAMAREIEGSNGLIDGFYRSTPDGMFAWAIVTDGPCFTIRAYIQPRLVLRTPQLSARIQNVMYTPLYHFQSPDPASPYFKRGGVSYRENSYYF